MASDRTRHVGPLRAVRRRAGRLAACLLVALAASTGLARSAAADAAAAGLAALDERDFATASKLLEEAIQSEPDDAFLHYALGVAALQLGRDVVALGALERAAALDPGLPGVQAELGLTLARLGERERAEPHLLEALVQGPEDADVLLQLGLLDVSRGELDRAIRMFEDAAVVDPGFAATAWYEAAGVALDRGDLDGAVAYLERAATAEGPEVARTRARELLAALAPAPPRRVALAVGAAIEYDDNLSVSAADLTTGVDDIAAVFDAGVELYAVRRPELQLSIGYDFYQSLYRTVTGLDLQSHAPFVQLVAGEGPLVGLASYRYTNDSLGGDGFLSTHRGDLGLEFTPLPWVVGLIGARLEGLGFDQSPDRSARRISLELGVRVFDPDEPVSIEIGWRPVWTDAEGGEFDYHGNGVTTRLDFAVPVARRTIDFRATWDWDGRDYDNVTQRIGVRRRDSRHLFGAGASMMLIGPTEVGLDYLHISSSSNIPELNYGENIVTLRVGAFY